MMALTFLVSHILRDLCLDSHRVASAAGAQLLELTVSSKDLPLGAGLGSSGEQASNSVITNPM